VQLNLTGQTLGKYRIVEEIGWGGMSVVHCSGGWTEGGGANEGGHGDSIQSSRVGP
jgi:hypothetical protein